MNIQNLVNPYIVNVPPYIPGKRADQVKGVSVKLYKLSSNENPYGPSPKALEAIRQAALIGNLYPDAGSHVLRSALAEKYGLDQENFLCAVGSSGIIAAICRTFLNPQRGDNTVSAKPAFSLYTDHTYFCGCEPKTIYLDRKKDYALDLNEIWDQIDAHTKIVFLCSPNNPTGRHIPAAELESFLKSLPDHVVVYMDEAYVEFSDSSDCRSMMPLINDCKVVVGRTFSKMYALCGLRVGYAAAAKEIIAAMAPTVNTFDVNTPGEWAAAAALKDTDYYGECYRRIVEGRHYLESGFQELGLKVYPSQANFLYIDPGIPSPEFAAKLEKKGFIIRSNFEDARISVGTEEANAGLLQAVKEVLEGR